MSVTSTAEKTISAAEAGTSGQTQEQADLRIVRVSILIRRVTTF